VDNAKLIAHRLRLKLRRKVRRQKRQVEDMTLQADDSIDRLVFKRFGNLYKVRRFVLAWVVLTMFIGLGSIWQVRGLDRFYLEFVPADGGVYREGVIGTFTNANPLFAVTNVDVSVSKLVFSGLFALAPDGSLEPDLATGYTADEKGLVYTVALREDVKWHDGEAFAADDVVFTYDTIKNPDVNSPLSSSWRGVAVEALDDYTVRFTLPDTLSSFKYSMTNGIIPEHVLSDVEPADLRTSAFNTVDPVGSGPFSYSRVEVIGSNPDERQEKVTLLAHSDYHKGRVKIDGVVVRTYRDEESMVEAFEDQLITAMVGLSTVPDGLLEEDTVLAYSTPLRSAVMVFFNSSRGALEDTKVRQALVRATNSNALRNSVDYQLIEVDSPFLKSHFAYDPEKVQQGFDIAEANRLLDEAGWARGVDGFRYKDDIKLSLRIVSQSLAEYSAVISELQSQLMVVGVDLEATLRAEEDVQSDVIVGHDYELLLYGIAVGPDPDIFAFWHSSQADPRLKTRLNLSEYTSDVADESLEAGRTRINEDLRTVKYRAFLDAWRTDAPAIALYQPRFLLVTRGAVDGYQSGQFGSPSDRFHSVYDWQIRREKAVQ